MSCHASKSIEMITRDKKDGPLQGLRVLDLADEKASFCSKLLADMGARVTRSGSPADDSSRKIDPLSEILPHPGNNLFFNYNNTNKYGIPLDLEHSFGRKDFEEVFCKLIEDIDILVESFAPGHLEQLGFGFEALRELNPRLILVSVTGFGQDGPRSKYKSCDIVAAAFGGQMYVSGSPTTPPLKPFGEQSYYTASLFAAVGTMLALRRRDQTGRGDHVDVSMQEAVAATLEHVMVRYFHEEVVSTRQGNFHWNNAFFISPCRDGHILMTLSQQWETLIEWLDSEGMAEDLREEKWCNEDYRQQHADHIIEVLQRWTKTHPREELFELGQIMRYPWAPVYSPREVLDSPHLRARGFFIEWEHPDTGASLKCPGQPYTFRRSSGKALKGAPLGLNHSCEALRTAPNRKDLMGDSATKPVLNGLRVLDFTWVLAGPYATRILADYGAEVIKVQSAETAKGAEANLSGYFAAWNRNKRSITLDMSLPEAREKALELAAMSDVVIENFSPRVMSNWGLDYETFKRAKPDLIVLTMSAMGRTGPWKDYVGFGPTIHALSGLTYLTSFKEESPLGLGYSYADMVAGLYAAFAVLAALESRDRTGQGDYIEVSEYEALCTLLGPTFLDVSSHNKKMLPQGNQAESFLAAPYGCYPCRGTDRWCVMAVFSDQEWEALCLAMGHPAWTKKEEFSTLSRRKEHKEKLNGYLARWTGEQTAEEVVRSLQEAGVPAGVVHNAEDLANDPQLRSRGFFAHLEHPTLGDAMTDTSPMKFSERAITPWKAAPLLGQDNQYVYRELLGLSEAEFASYIEKGIIY